MPFNRRLWKRRIYKDNLRWWPCPFCQEELKLSEGSLHSGETAQSAIADKYGPQDEVGRFSCLLECTKCPETVAVCGWLFTEEEPPHVFQDPETGDITGESDPSYHDFLIPIYIFPAPLLFPIPKECSEAVVETLKESFSLYWCDINAAANRARTAVEFLLDGQKVKRGPNKDPYSLHKRIKLWKERNEKGKTNRHKNFADLADKLMSVKWIGNPGSHASKKKLTRDDLCDGLEILSYALDEMYHPTRERIEQLSKAINRRKGPLKRGTRRRRR
jgi:hypothetical protein